MAVQEVTSFCRICGGGCGVRITLEDGRMVAMRGDKSQPLSQGYACGKGLQAIEAHHGPGRLLHPLKRMPDGRFVEISLEQALSEIENKLRAQIAARGPEALGIYVGGGSAFNAAALAMQSAFMAAIGSSQLYSTLTIDQSAKVVSFERMGAWAPGLNDFEESDVVMMVGANPMVSHGVSVLVTNPVRRIRQARERGLKMIVIDPRFSETARHADLFLQPLPGFDLPIMASLLRIILEEGWHDADFCARHVDSDSFARLIETVRDFDPAAVEARAGLAPGQIRQAAEIFARDARKGAAFGATGVCMARSGNTALHLLDCLNVVCGRTKRPGDRVIFDVLGAKYPVHAEVISPPRSFDSVPKSRIRGVGRLAGEKLTSTLAEEILTPGEGQVRSLLVVGANPAVGIPDQRRIVEALRSLELLVCVDPFMNETAALAHYILPTIMQYERADLPLSLDGYALFPAPWVQYTPPIVDPPAGSDLIEEARFYWEIAARLGKQITFRGVPLPMDRAPTTEEMLTIRLKGARMTLDELKQAPSGLIWEDPEAIVQEARPGAEARLDVMPPDVAEEVRDFRRRDALAVQALESDDPPTHLLSVRRMREVFCSTGRHLPEVRKRAPYNPASFNPADLDAMGIAVGDRVALTSRHGRVVAIAKADETLRAGVVTLAHGWGGLPDQNDNDQACVNLLTSTVEDLEPINAMPLMSAIPVRVERVGAALAAAE
ncbi:MAG: molybdopterin-dependent oxidoreductase [Caulobacterales bacterium]